jgi:hypothetical protein
MAHAGVNPAVSRPPTLVCSQPSALAHSLAARAALTPFVIPPRDPWARQATKHLALPAADTVGSCLQPHCSSTALGLSQHGQQEDTAGSAAGSRSLCSQGNAAAYNCSWLTDEIPLYAHGGSASCSYVCAVFTMSAPHLLHLPYRCPW